MKIKLTKLTKPAKDVKEIEIGERGDFILVRGKGRDNYTFGRLEGVVKVVDRHGEPSKRYDAIKFMGDSYNFRTNEAFGLKIPVFAKRPNAGFHPTDYRYFSIQLIEEVIPGIGNIIRYLDTNPEYKGHADLIRKIAESKK